MLSGTDCSGNGEGFSDELSRLKRQGASVLVVGSVRPDQRRNACQRLMGCGVERDRRRVLVSTTGGPHRVSRFVEDGGLETLSVVTYDAQARSAAAAGVTAPPSIEPVSTETETLAELGIAISNAIESYETDADGLEPAEIRVGMDSLLPLLEEYGRQRVFKFLHLINGRTRDVDGMAHYHLQVERDARVVPVLTPLFDVVVELREQNGDPQERWILEDGTYSSGWLSVGPE